LRFAKIGALATARQEKIAEWASKKEQVLNGTPEGTSGSMSDALSLPHACSATQTIFQMMA